MSEDTDIIPNLRSRDYYLSEDERLKERGRFVDWYENSGDLDRVFKGLLIKKQYKSDLGDLDDICVEPRSEAFFFEVVFTTREKSGKIKQFSVRFDKLEIGMFETMHDMRLHFTNRLFASLSEAVKSAKEVTIEPPHDPGWLEEQLRGMSLEGLPAAQKQDPEVIGLRGMWLRLGCPELHKGYGGVSVVHRIRDGRDHVSIDPDRLICLDEALDYRRRLADFEKRLYEFNLRQPDNVHPVRSVIVTAPPDDGIVEPCQGDNAPESPVAADNAATAEKTEAPEE